MEEEPETETAQENRQRTNIQLQLRQLRNNLPRPSSKQYKKLVKVEILNELKLAMEMENQDLSINTPEHSDGFNK